MRLGELFVRGYRKLFPDRSGGANFLSTFDGTGILPVLSWRYWFPQRTLGQRGELAAAKFLKRRGYKILATGDRLKHRDELDIIAADGRTVVFVEVKTRTSQRQGHPAEAVDARKQRKLTKLAVLFLKRHRLLDYSARFDVIAITWPENARKPQIEHIENAFEAVGKWEFYS